MDVASPITSDEEYMSPMEESMDYGSSYRGPSPRTIMDTRFKEPPAFQVACLFFSFCYSIARLVVAAHRCCHLFCVSNICEFTDFIFFINNHF